MSIRTVMGRMDSTTVKWKVDDAFKAMCAAGKAVHFVHDDGVYLCSWHDKTTKPVVVRPYNDGGMEAGYGDDFGEDLGVLEVPEHAVEFHIKVMEETMEVIWELKRPAADLDAQLRVGWMKALKMRYSKNGVVAALTHDAQKILVWVREAKGNRIVGQLNAPYGDLKRGAWVSFGKDKVFTYNTPAEVRAAQKKVKAKQ